MTVGMMQSGRARSRRDPLNTALLAPLEQARLETHSDIALVLRAERSADGAGPGAATVLAVSGAANADRFLPNEPVALSLALPATVVALQELTLTSVIRPFRIVCGASLCMPWRCGRTQGWLIVGRRDGTAPARGLHKLARQYGRLLRETYAEAGLRRTNRLQQDLAQAIRALGEIEGEAETPDDLIANVLAVGRRLLGTSACYLSLPTQDADTFCFTNLLGVRTSAFKRLRMRGGQGLGGLARQEGRVVRSLNYAQDFLDRDAPVRETVQEGFQSAMCTPLVADGRILGLLYAANRNLTPFSDSDGALLEEFAGNVSLMFKRAQWERLRRSAAQRHERDRLARDLHDTVVRRLMEIGQESRLGRDAADAAGAIVHFAAIEDAAQACLRTIRGHIGALTSDWESAQPPTAEQVIHLLAMFSRPRSLKHHLRIAPVSQRRPMDPAVAAALVRIGREALQNAELHAGGARVEVELTVSRATARLTIDDDGGGIDPERLPRLLASRDHLGLRQMRAAAHDLGGQCRLGAAPIGGLRVDVTIPLA